jgi:multidrug efflux system outer membrane protein
VDAARAALYPKITLTGVAGVATTALASLFSPANFAWRATAASWPIFKGGGQGHHRVRPGPARRRSGRLSQNGATAFQDVANVLARRGTIEAQIEADRRRDAASDNYRSPIAAIRAGSAHGSMR